MAILFPGDEEEVIVRQLLGDQGLNSSDSRLHGSFAGVRPPTSLDPEVVPSSPSSGSSRKLRYGTRRTRAPSPTF